MKRRLVKPGFWANIKTPLTECYWKSVMPRIKARLTKALRYEPLSPAVGSMIRPCCTVLDEAVVLPPKEVVAVFMGVPWVKLKRGHANLPITSWIQVRP